MIDPNMTSPADENRQEFSLIRAIALRTGAHAGLTERKALHTDFSSPILLKNYDEMIWTSLCDFFSSALRFPEGPGQTAKYVIVGK